MDQFQSMGTSQTKFHLLLIILMLAGCGSDVPHGEIEGAPRTSEAI
jgi:hypothetical protein